MEKKDILSALEKAKKETKKRNFKQAIDFSIVLKEVDLNKPEGKIDDFISLPNPTGRKTKVCGLVDKDLSTQSREVFDMTITKEEFSKYSGKLRDLKKLARAYDYFVAQATIMTDIAATFGKAFGPKGKMPSPKAGCIVQSKADLKVLNERLQKMVLIKTKKQPVISIKIGMEDSPDEEVADNAMAVYEFIKKRLPCGDQQIKKTYIKLTMGKPEVTGA